VVWAAVGLWLLINVEGIAPLWLMALGKTVVCLLRTQPLNRRDLLPTREQIATLLVNHMQSTEFNRSKIIGNAKRVVVKVGSRVLGATNDPFGRLASEIAQIRADGKEVVLVSSGAVLLGREKLGLKEKPKTIPLKQAAAAAGQSRLMRRYEDVFAAHKIEVAQILLTHADLAHRERFLNARRAIQQLLEYGILPVINENDTVATEELKFGDNDHLSSLVVGLIGADLLIILSDIDALYDKDPKQHSDAKPVRVVEDLEGIDTTGSSDVGTGGMATKTRAALAAARYGAPTILTSGMHPQNLLSAARGIEVGTLFLPKERLSARKHWLAFALKPKGALSVDAGAVRALVEQKKSLLPKGVTAVSGEFSLGEPISIVGPSGDEIARGLAGYSSDEVAKIKGKNSSEIETILGYKSLDEVVHRDDLVILQDQ
jgi:glutamate 5-kinase